MILPLITLVAIVVYAQSPLLSFISWDMEHYFFHWYNQAMHHGLSFVGTTRSNYPPSYLYIIWALTHIPLPKLYVIKTFSIIFNFLTAFMACKVVRLKYGKDSLLPSLTYGAILFSPTVFLNSIMWGQNDAVYVFFTMTALFLLMQSKNKGSTILSLLIFAVGIAFKLQPISLLPMYIIVLVRRRISLYYLLILPSFYFLTTIPALMLGRTIKNLIFMPGNRLNHHRLSANAPNIYLCLPHWKFLLMGGGILYLLLVLLMSVKVCSKYRGQPALPMEMILKLALFFSILTPFLLPGMHERYFFLADILSIIYAFYWPRYFYIPLCINMASFFSYFKFLQLNWIITDGELTSLALLNLMALLMVLQEIII